LDASDGVSIVSGERDSVGERKSVASASRSAIPPLGRILHTGDPLQLLWVFHARQSLCPSRASGLTSDFSVGRRSRILIAVVAGIAVLLVLTKKRRPRRALNSACVRTDGLASSESVLTDVRDDMKLTLCVVYSLHSPIGFPNGFPLNFSESACSRFS
jgi:hypothetical protein